MRWWELFCGEIRPVEVQRGSDTNVWINGRRRAKKSDVCSYYQSWDEARQALVSELFGKELRAQSQVDHYRAKKQAASQLKKPEGA